MDEECSDAGFKPQRNAAVPTDPGGLGSSVPDFWDGELRTVTSPYPSDDGKPETLLAMPALRLDAAFVHLNLGDRRGNAAYTGIDPTSTTSSDGRRSQIPVGRQVVSTEDLIKGFPASTPDQSDDGRPRGRGPNGAHFTTAEPDYRRDEKFPAPLRAGRGRKRNVDGVREHLPVRRRGRLPGGGAPIPTEASQ